MALPWHGFSRSWCDRAEFTNNYREFTLLAQRNSPTHHPLLGGVYDAGGFLTLAAPGHGEGGLGGLGGDLLGFKI